MTESGDRRILQTLVTEIKHRSHEHNLTLTQGSIPYKCNGCEELGFGVRYECKLKCNFHLHEVCADPPSPHRHPLLESCKLEFRYQSPAPEDKVICDACLRYVRGYYYFGEVEKSTCSGSKIRHLHLHPTCAKLEPVKSGRPAGGGKEVQLYLKGKVSTRCLKCHIGDTSSKGWCYASGEYCLHVGCGKEIMYESWKKGYFGQEGQNATNSDSLTIPSTSTVARKSRMDWTEAAELFISTLISAIFGDPTTIIGNLAVGLFRSLFRN